MSRNVSEPECIEIEADTVEQATALASTRAPQGHRAEITVIACGGLQPRTRGTRRAVARSVEAARQKILDELPDGYEVIDERITTTPSEGRVFGHGRDAEDAERAAMSVLPSNVVVTERRLVRDVSVETITVDATSVDDARRKAAAVMAEHELPTEVVEAIRDEDHASSLRRVLGRRRRYSVLIRHLAEAAVDYRVQASLEVTIGTHFERTPARIAARFVKNQV